MKKAIILIVTVLMSTFAFGQEELIAGKTTEQIIKEYKSWSRMKNDWANLARYQQENEALASREVGDTRVVFMGNSITQNWVSQRPEFFLENNYLGRGISGQTTPQMVLRFRQDVIDLNPDMVVILAGTNDIAGNTGPTTQEMITDNIFNMVNLAQANEIKVILCSVLPANAYFWNPDLKPADRIIDLNARLKAFAEDNNIPYVDYFSAMVDGEKGLKKEYGKDGVHPNLAGYAVMEPMIKEAIEKELGR